MQRVAAVLLAAVAAAASVPARADTPAIEPRIANGLETFAFPEVGTFLTSNATCTATFIGCRTAVTAAHCVCDAAGTGPSCGGGEYLLDPSTVSFFAPQAGVFAIDRIEIPGNYAFGIAGDVAVLRLASEVRGVRPRHINELTRAPFGTPATIVGYGTTTQSSADNGLLRVGAVLIANCSDAGVSNFTQVCWNYVLPAGAPGTDSNTCPGDSGGPLLFNVGAGLTLGGIHSGGNGDCQASGSSFDTDVFIEAAWLRSLAGVDLDSGSCGDGAQVGDAGVGSQGFVGTAAPQATNGFTVGASTKLLRVGLTGTQAGDVDLYVNPGAPAIAGAACGSASGGSYEYCEIQDPAPGPWYAVTSLAAGGATPYQLSVTQLPESPAPPPLATGRIATTNFTTYEATVVDPADGSRAVASSSLRGAGPRLAGPEGLALDRDRTLVVANPFDRNVLRIDLGSGQRAVVSGCADPVCSSTVGSGAAFLSPRFVAFDANRNILVSDRSVAGTYAIVRVDPATGGRTVVSGCTDSTCAAVVGAGPAIARLFGITVDATGAIYVADGQAVYRIDAASGDRTLVSGCVDAACTTVVGGGPVFGQPTDLAIGPGGALFVTYQIDGATFGALRRIDPASGDRTLVSGCEDVACTALRGAGPGFVNLFGIHFDLDGATPLVADSMLEAVLRVDPASGDRTVVSGCTDAACSTQVGPGPAFGQVLDLAVVPEPGSAALAAGAAAALGAVAWRRRGRA